MGLLTLHGQSALHATQTAERARTESIANVFCFTGNDKLSASNVNYTHRRRFLLVFKSLNRVKQLIDLERFLGRCETALSLAMCIQRATNWHKTCTQTSLIQAKRKIVWFDLLPSAQCLCVRSFFTHQKYIFFSQFITTSMCVSDLFTSFLAFYFIVQSDGVTELWRRNDSNVR